MMEKEPSEKRTCPLFRSAPPGDFNTDNDVDMADFGHFQACHSGSGVLCTSACEDADFDKDGDVDSKDLNQLLGCLNGADETPACR